MVREFWRHGSNAVLAVVIIFDLVMTAASWPAHWVLFVLGALLFFGSEYGYHRFAFHAPPATRIPFLLKLQHRLHYDHHVEPARLDLLFLPVWFIIPNFVVTGAVAWLIWPSAACVAALLAGVSAAIVYYEWVHYVAHIAYRPRTVWGRWIKKYHLWHHFKNEHFWFGVTNPGFDLVARTYLDVDAAASSGTTRRLHR